MIPLLAGAVFACLAVAIARHRILVFTMPWMLLGFAWRVTSAIYIDTQGPVFATQPGRDVGPGSSSAALVATFVLTLLPFLIVFRPSRIAEVARRVQEEQEPELRFLGVELPTVAGWMFAAFILLLFFDLVARGVVPLFAGMERFEYTMEYGGHFHNLLDKYGNLLAFYLGVFFANGLMQGKPPYRFPLLLSVLFMYLLLVGNKFSTFFSYACLFLFPLGAVRMAGRAAVRPMLSAATSARGWMVTTAAVMCFAGGIVYGQYNTLNRTRGLDQEIAIENLKERIFVQHAEFWWLTFERVFDVGDYDPAEAVKYVFLDPIQGDRNTSIQYLMMKEIGEKRTIDLVAQRNQYGGGNPEILFEILGPVLGFFAAAGLGYVTAALAFLVLRSIALRRFVTVFSAFYVLYAFLLFELGGMLNFIVNWKFWMKVAIMLVAVFFGSRRRPVATEMDRSLVAEVSPPGD